MTKIKKQIRLTFNILLIIVIIGKEYFAFTDY